MGISEALGEKATQYLSALEELTTQYAPDLLEACKAMSEDYYDVDERWGNAALKLIRAAISKATEE